MNLGKKAGLGALLLSPLLFFALAPSAPILFESLESKTETGEAVFNQIGFVWGWKRDLWLMRQGHAGLSKPMRDWDRLAIVVDKTSRPYRSTFIQFAPGELKLASRAEAVPFSARCFACHANGPRAVRPREDSPSAPIGWREKIVLGLWNLRVKSYGRVQSLADPASNGGIPFRSPRAVMSRSLGLNSCLKCHASDGIRNDLQLEQLGTANFLVQNGLMPPFPFSIPPSEMRRLKELTENF